MKKFWKILGLGALAVGLTPYKVEKNEETGERSYQALLWRLTSAPGEDEDKRSIDVTLGLPAELMDAVKKTEEPHLFSDELCVEYNGGENSVSEAVEEAAEAAEEAAEETVEAVEEAGEAVEEAAEAAEEAVKETVEAVEEAVEEPQAE